MIKILINADSRYPIDRKKIREKVKQVLLNKGLTADTELSILFVGNRKMKQLNQKYLKKKETTDVLSFSLTEGEGIMPDDNILHLGDVVISYPQARKQASQYNRLVDDEINELVEHGLKHLLGIHHS